MRRLAVVLAASLTLAACGGSPDLLVGVPRPGTLAVADSVDITPTLAELRQMQGRWAEVRAGRDYTFVTYYYCFCGGDVATPVLVTVHDAAVTSVRELKSGQSRSADGYYTIETLFDRALARRAIDDKVRVRWSPGAGYPLWLTIGTPENDAGVSYRIERVRFE